MLLAKSPSGEALIKDLPPSIIDEIGPDSKSDVADGKMLLAKSPSGEALIKDLPIVEAADTNGENASDKIGDKNPDGSKTPSLGAENFSTSLDGITISSL